MLKGFSVADSEINGAHDDTDKKLKGSRIKVVDNFP